MITSLRLRNWKSHLDSEFKFSPGVNALLGIVGSGKSSIMQAVSFGLFGTVPSAQARKIKLEELIMRKPQPKKKAEVEIGFRAGEDEYQVRRVLEEGKGTTEAEFRRNGVLIDVNPKNVNREVENALQMDFELFSKAVYSEQNELDHFLRIPRGKRMEHIDRMLKVDRFEKAREQSVSLRNRLEAGMEEKVKVLADLEREGIEEKEKNAREEIGKLGKEVKELVKSREEITKKRDKAEERLRKLEEKQEELEEARSGLKASEHVVRELEGQLKERKKINVRDIGKLIEEFREDAGRISERIEEKTREMGELNGKIKAIQESMEEFGKVEGKCPVCESDITKEKREEVVNIRKGREGELREKVKAVVDGIRNIREEKEAAESRLEELRKEKIRQEETAEIEKRMEAHLKRKGELEKVMEKLGEVPKEEMVKLREEVKELAAKSAEVWEKASGLERLLEEKRSAAEGLKERLEMLKTYRKEAERDKVIGEWLEKFTRALRMTQEQLREEFVKTVNSIMEEVWAELYPYGDFRGIRLAVDGDYILQLKGVDGWTNVEGVVSGGERSMACLALRVAFSYAFIPNLKWLILDEPTHNLDANSIAQLGEVLRDRMKAFAEQVFLITHEDRISEGVDSLYRLERDKGKDEPTRVVAG